MSEPVWDHIADHFDVSPFSWWRLEDGVWVEYRGEERVEDES